LVPLELPGREAPNVNVELVEAWALSVVSELDLELHFILLDRSSADGTFSANTGTTPCPIRSAGGELAVLDGFAGLFAEARFVRHVGLPR
jgi:hypothetical protein